MSAEATRRLRRTVVTIEAHRPFLDTLAARLGSETRGDPLALSRITVLLPTRRACRALGEAFLRWSAGRPMLLPRLLPVGDLDAEELALHVDESTPQGLDLPPALPELQRRLLLAKLVLRWAQARDEAMLPGQAAMLGAALARFLDEVQTEGADFAGLASLVPEELAEHWQEVLRFLGIVTAAWPEMLSEEGALDPADRRNRVLAAQAELWRAKPPPYPVIAAGMTGGVPAVAALMEVVAGLPRGTVVLPGLDRGLPEEVWTAVRSDPSHPQHLLARFLERIELSPAEVGTWEGPQVAAGPTERQSLLRAALLPASCTAEWRAMPSLGDDALRGFRRLDCAGPQEEAQAIALLMREALERPEATAALVTPDRGLARRVAAELRRWGIEIDDSAGVPLNKTPPGVLLRLVLELVAEQAAPVALLAALKHPLAACGMDPAEFRHQVRALERAVLRGVRPSPGLDGILDALDPTAFKFNETVAHQDLVRRLRRCLAPLFAAIAAPRAALRELAAAHVTAAEALAATSEMRGADQLWRGEAGEAAAEFLAELLAAAEKFPQLAGADYPALFESLMAGRVVRPRYGGHPRLAIWGLLEARLQRADLMILGGLNEGTWPADPADDPWMSRPMRRRFGVTAPEQRIGLAAHDLVQALGAPETVLTRAVRVEGTPTLPSRWLLRLDAILHIAGRERAISKDGTVLAWQRLLDAPAAEAAPAPPPVPCPPLAARPRRLSVTEIETWMRDPYAIYAKHVLKLQALEPLDAEPDARERGIAIHTALGEFVATYPAALPADAEMRLLEFGRKAFGALLTRPGIWAFWWPRFERIMEWFLEQERARRPGLALLVSETRGTLELSMPRGPFTLVGKADRIEAVRGGGLTIVDYKTGVPPTKPEVGRGLAPQLPLEAAIAAAGGFAAVPVEGIAALEYWRLGGLDPAGERKIIADGSAAALLIEDARAGLLALVERFDDPTTPYRARPVPERAPRYSDYVHLERVKEWRAEPEEE